MSGDTLASLVYLILLITAIGGYFLLSGRQSIGRSLQQLAIWAMIFVGFIAGYGLWRDVSHTLVPRQTVFNEGARVEVPVSKDGHYYLTLRINDRPVEFVVDTGASDIVLNARDATRIGFRADDLSFNGVASTANGTVRTARVYLNTVALGGVEDTRVQAVVNGGELDKSLLGMRYLNRWGSVQFDSTVMVLTR